MATGSYLWVHYNKDLFSYKCVIILFSLVVKCPMKFIIIYSYDLGLVNTNLGHIL